MSTSNNRQRVALVTGCSEPTSLGVATVKHLHSKGWKVIATARKVETMKALQTSGIEVCFTFLVWVRTDNRPSLLMLYRSPLSTKLWRQLRSSPAVT